MRRRTKVLIWMTVVVALFGFVSQLSIDTDMTAFLPHIASPAQRVLADQLRDGVVSRLVLVAVEGAPIKQLTAISNRLAAVLRGQPAFESVENGEKSSFAHDRDFLWSHRYLLSDLTESDRFTADGLRSVLARDLDELGSASGFLLERTLAADPTGEMLHLIEQQMDAGSGPARQNGVWTSPDASRALLLVRLRAAGPDIDGAQRALATIQAGFATAAADTPNKALRLVMTGPPVFAVEARNRIKSDATRLSVLASLLVAAALLAAYRSPLVLLLAFVPVVTGALAGIAAVGLAFRTVHGITLGFGATLIGEAIDYAVYLFTQTSPESPVEQTLQRIWPTIRLGVLTSICGFSAMLLSSFNGFVQLGLFTITGLTVAAGVTRFVLPAMLPERFAGVRQSPAMARLAAIATNGRLLRPAVAILTAAAAASLAVGHGDFWAGDLSSLSPVPPAEQRLDQSLRRDMRAPGATTLVVTRKSGGQAALEAAERLTRLLRPVMQQHGLAGIDTPSLYLPSMATQRARQAALPDAATLQARLDTALGGLPFQPGLFIPFVTDASQQRTLAPITRTELNGTSLSLKLDSLLLHQYDGWVAVLSLRDVTAPDAVARVIGEDPDAVLVDLKAESARLLQLYLWEGMGLASLGAGAITLLLMVSLRSWRRLALVIAPLVAAVVVTFAVLHLGGHALSIFNLFGVLLVVAIGSNYCLFFDRQRADPSGMPRILTSLLLANGCTVTGFGVLALSHTPVLHDLGMPVAIGTALSLIFAIIIMCPSQISHAPPR
jgi:predicted exporter